MLHQAVEYLEPGARLAVIRERATRRHGLDFPLLRLSVDLDCTVADGLLTRRSGPHRSGTGTAFFDETFGAVSVEPPRPRAEAGTAGAPPIHVRAEPPPSPRVPGLAP